MFLGLSAFTWFHTLLSLVALVAGIVVVVGFLGSHKLNGWAAVFLVTAVATSVTGFMFPFDKFLPSHLFGVISLVLLAAAIAGLYLFHLAGAWRWIYVVAVALALYLDAFVAVVQAFQKLPALQPLAPTQSEPPFAIAQVVLLVIAVVLIVAGVIKFRPGSGSA